MEWYDEPNPHCSTQFLLAIIEDIDVIFLFYGSRTVTVCSSRKKIIKQNFID